MAAPRVEPKARPRTYPVAAIRDFGCADRQVVDGQNEPGHEGGYGAARAIPGQALMRLLLNPRHGTPGVVVLPAAGFRRAKTEITAWKGYAPTPLHDLPALAAKAGVATIRLKDESPRFGLGSFKALGGAYAVAALLGAELARRSIAANAGSGALASGEYGGATGAITVTCATDGNHGRAAAWGAGRFHCR